LFAPELVRATEAASVEATIVNPDALIELPERENASPLPATSAKQREKSISEVL
jgi:hypothetical protein